MGRADDGEARGRHATVDQGAMTLTVVGVDGTRDGWIAIAMSEGGRLSGGVSPTFRQLLDSHADASIVAVDVPIGAPDVEHYPRLADVQAEAMIHRRRSSSGSRSPRRWLPQPTPRRMRSADAMAYPASVSRRGLSHRRYAMSSRMAPTPGCGKSIPRCPSRHWLGALCSLASGHGRDSGSACSFFQVPRWTLQRSLATSDEPLSTMCSMPSSRCGVLDASLTAPHAHSHRMRRFRLQRSGTSPDGHRPRQASRRDGRHPQRGRRYWTLLCRSRGARQCARGLPEG